MGYLTNFIVYTLAMVGIIMLALFVFKATTFGSTKSSGKCLKVLDTLSLGARKNLYIVSAGNEKFLIAGDADRTTLISKLNPTVDCGEKISAIMSSEPEIYTTQSFKDTLSSLPQRKESYMDRTVVGIKTSSKSPYNSVLKNLAEKMQDGVNIGVNSGINSRLNIGGNIDTNNGMSSFSEINSSYNLRGGV